jgi:hypothetical protein
MLRSALIAGGTAATITLLLVAYRRLMKSSTSENEKGTARTSTSQKKVCYCLVLMFRMSIRSRSHKIDAVAKDC